MYVTSAAINIGAYMGYSCTWKHLDVITRERGKRYTEVRYVEVSLYFTNHNILVSRHLSSMVCHALNSKAQKNRISKGRIVERKPPTWKWWNAITLEPAHVHPKIPQNCVYAYMEYARWLVDFACLFHRPALLVKSFGYHCRPNCIYSF
jgi:hypothetical protein